MVFAAPVDATTNAVADVNDGCSGASKLILYCLSILRRANNPVDHHGACERGRDEKHDGIREIQKGEREMARGQEYRGARDISQGAHEVRQGEHRECRAGGRC